VASLALFGSLSAGASTAAAKSWQLYRSTTLPAIAHDDSLMTCAASGKCVIAPFGGGGLFVSGSSPGSWKVLPSAGSSVQSSDISCVAQQCVVVGVVGSGGLLPAVAAYSHDLGEHWRTARLPQPSYVGSSDSWAVTMTGVSCASAEDCVAVGWAGPGHTDEVRAPLAWGTENGGATWRMVDLPVSNYFGAGYFPEEVSCTSAAFCVIGTIPGAILVTTTGISGFKFAQTPPAWRKLLCTPAVPGGCKSANILADAGRITALSCAPATEDCTAAGSVVANNKTGGAGPYIVASSAGGRVWSADSTGLTGSGWIGGPAVACPSSRACVAVINVAQVGTPGTIGFPTYRSALIESEGGMTSWHQVTLPSVSGESLGINAVACPGPTDCVANAYTFKGSGSRVQDGSAYTLTGPA
jgi:hypothetical protein